MRDSRERSTRTRVSDESVRTATGRGWDEWLEALDRAGAKDWNHKEIVAYLEREHADVGSSWWRQTITVEYEKARGKRVLGETAAAGFEIGVQRTVPLSAHDAWRLVTSSPDLWLGEGARVDFAAGERYEVPERPNSPAVSGEIRVVKPGERLRMTWHPKDWSSPAILQLTFTEKVSGRTAISAHMEKLPNAAARDAMRRVLSEGHDRIAAAAREKIS